VVVTEGGRFVCELVEGAGPMAMTEKANEVSALLKRRIGA